MRDDAHLHVDVTRYDCDTAGMESRNIAESIKAARLALGWSVEEAARRADMSRITWKRIEDGQSVHDTSLSKAQKAVDVPQPLSVRYDYTPPPRPLDHYTTAELIAEVEQRFAELALELHSVGRPAMASRQEGQDEVLEPMSPQQRRDELKRRRNEPTDLSTRRAMNGDRAESDQE